MNFLNEEELRSTLIVPLLIDLGYSYSDLKLETSFSIQLGRGVYNVANEQKRFIGGRLDILCKVNNINLFIIELKAENVDLDIEKDKRQGLSYARLLEPMPPIVLLSNGKKTILFDTITGSEIDKSKITTGDYKSSIGDEIELRYEALKSFVGYSEDNLSIFCASFNNNYLKKYRCENSASVTEILQKKYTSDIFINRGEINKEFEEFLFNQETWIFPIIGESGTGKTNSIINLYEHFSDFPSIFYSGTDLGASLFEEFKFDFNLEFSPNETELSLLKKISAICSRSNKPFIIFLDAIDEWMSPDALQQLERLTKILVRYQIKLCITCKDLMWSLFLTHKGLPTHLSNHLFREQRLESFSQEELLVAAEKYSDKLGLEYIADLLPDDIRNPFSLRIACEVCKLTNKRLEASENSRMTLDYFIDQKLIKTSNPDKNRRFLIAISQQLLQSDLVQISENTFRGQIGLSIHEEIPIELFASGFLYKNLSDKADVQIGFYFSKIRDFIITKFVLNLENLSSIERIASIKENINSYIGQNAINYYFKTGNAQEKSECFDAFIEYDNVSKTAYLFRILAQQDVKSINDLGIESTTKILDYLKEVVSVEIDWDLIDKEIVTFIKLLPLNERFNSHYIDTLLALDKIKGHDAHLISTICRVLGKTDDKLTTKQLVDLVTNRSLKSNIRRFLIDSLESRTVDYEQVFRILLDEAFNTDVLTPLFYCKNWYQIIETPELRSTLLKMFESNNNVNFRTIVIKCLALSKLDGTAAILFEKFQHGTYDDENVWWMSRAISSLNHKEAIPKFIEILEKNPNSELAGHILIGAGKMKARDMMPTILNMIENLTDEKNQWWLLTAFRDLAKPSDFEKMEKIYLNTKNKKTKFIALQSFAEQTDEKFYPLVLNGVSDLALNIQNRISILSSWSNMLMSDYLGEGIFYGNSTPRISKPSSFILTPLYQLLIGNTELSPYALSILINIEDQIEKLSNQIINNLQQLDHKLKTRQHSLSNIDNLKELGIFINPWLKKTLNRKDWPNKTFLFNCIQLAGILGDSNLLEIIHINRPSIVSNHPLGAKYISYIEHIIRTAPTSERIFLDDF